MIHIESKETNKKDLRYIEIEKRNRKAEREKWDRKTES